jgi:TPR repeat protein
MKSQAADALFREASSVLPGAKDPDPKTVPERKARAIALFERAAKLGHVEAMRELANLLHYAPDLPACFAWCVRLAKLGDVQPLQDVLGDLPESLAGQVQAAAAKGEAWAQYAKSDRLTGAPAFRR